MTYGDSRVERIDDVDSYEVETVGATAHHSERGGFEWRYEREIHLKAGDAMENPPPIREAGQTCTVRIIRGYDRMGGAVEA